MVSETKRDNEPNDKLIKRTRPLNRNQYTISLLNEGMRTGQISKEKMENLQLQIMDILKEVIMMYTKGESTSVKVETAENLLNSVLYSTDCSLKNFGEPESALLALKSISIKEIYNKGLELVATCVKESMELYQSLRKERLKVGLEVYEFTLDEALPLFFEKYGIVFDAHNTMASIDYPLLFDDTKINGIFYIRRYLETLDVETRFCSLFPDKEIKKVLITYGRMYKIDYTKTLTNIFELVFNASFFSVLSEGSAFDLSISEIQYGISLNKLSKSKPHQLGNIIDETIEKVTRDLKISDIELSEYIARYKPVLKTSVRLALEIDSLKKLILIDDNLSTISEKTIFIKEEKMFNDEFRELTERLTDGLNAEAKIKIIRSEVHSLEDFTDILEAECLFGDEYQLLFSNLSDLELGVLGRIVFSDEIREGPIDLNDIILTEFKSDVEWHVYMLDFLKSVDDEKLSSIEEQMNVITGTH